MTNAAMDNNAIKISVIIPVYNMAAYLAESLHSVQTQTLREIELICINDGSTDNSLQILQQHAAADSRIRIIVRKNHGVGPSRNVGIQAARGQFVAFLDPDDLYPAPNTLALLYTKARQNNALICGGSLGRFDDTPQHLRQDFGSSQQAFIFHSEGFSSYTDYQYEYGFYRFIYQRQMLITHRIGFPPYPRFQDPPFMVRAMLCAGRFYAIPDITYAYRVEHKTVNWTAERIDGLLNGIRDIWQLATMHKLNVLKRYIGLHTAEHCSELGSKLTPAQIAELEDLDEQLRQSQLNFSKWLFSKHKHIANRKIRKFTILGFTFRFCKR